MPRALAPGITACMLAVGLLSASGMQASGTRSSPDTARILEAIEQSRARRTPADMKAARGLNADGDRAYKKRNYKAAFRAYANSYPNYPNAHAYILTGDAHWRAVVHYHESEARRLARDRLACVDNNDFASHLALDVAQHHEVGLALAIRESDQRFMQSTLYRRARESASCLRSMAQHYETLAPSACVDMERLRDCLGAPLIK